MAEATFRIYARNPDVERCFQEEIPSHSFDRIRITVRKIDKSGEYTVFEITISGLYPSEQYNVGAIFVARQGVGISEIGEELLKGPNPGKFAYVKNIDCSSFLSWLEEIDQYGLSAVI
jgi:hypothetical protein